MMGMVTACDWVPGCVTTTLAVPETVGSGSTSHGTCAAIMFSDTNWRGAAMPLKVTETLAMVVERGTVSRRARPEAPGESYYYSGIRAFFRIAFPRGMKRLGRGFPSLRIGCAPLLTLNDCVNVSEMAADNGP